MNEAIRETLCIVMMLGMPALLMWKLGNTEFAVGAAMFSAACFVFGGAALISN